MGDAVEIGGIKARLEVDISGYTAGIDKAKAKVEELGTQGQKTASDFKSVTTAIDNVGSSSERIGKLTTQLDNVNAKIDQQKSKLASLKESYDNTFNEAKKSKLQDQILNTEATLLRLTDTSDQLAQKIWKIEDSSAVTGDSIKKLTDQLKQLGMTDEDISKIDQAIKKANPELFQQKIEDVRNEMRRLGISSDEIDKITKKLSEADEQANKTTGKLNGLESALLAIGAGVAFKGLIDEMKSLVAESEKVYNATRGLAEVSKNLGYNVNETTSAVQNMTKEGFMNATESAQAYKTALAMGLNIEQTTKLIYAMADAAAYNRQAHYSWGESIVVAMEGIKNGNSTLTDSVGVTKNLSVMQAEYAKSIGTTAAKLTDAQKVQAAYNGFLKESEIFAGNASVALGDYTGNVAKYDQAMQSLEAGVGDALKPLFAELLETITPIIQALAGWVVENKELVAGIAGAATAVTGFVALIGIVVGAMTTWRLVADAVRVSLTALNLSMGPLGWAIAAIGLVAGGIAAYAAHARDAAKAAEEMSEAQRKVNEQLDKSPVDRNVNELKQLQEQEKELTSLLEERGKVQERVNQIESMSGDNFELLPELDTLRDKLEEIDEQLRAAGHGSFEEATENAKRMREEIDKSSVAMYQMNKEEYDAIEAKREHQDEVEALMERYKTLNAQTKLTESQNNDMKQTINDLKKEYPDLTWAIDEQGRARITNIDIIGDQIQAERDLLDESVRTKQAEIDNLIKVTEANKAAIEAQINNYQRLIEVMQEVANAQQTGPLMEGKSKTRFGVDLPGMDQYESGFRDYITEQADRDMEIAKQQSARYDDAIKEMGQKKQSLSSGNFIPITKDPLGSSKTKKKKEKKAKTPAQLRKEAYDADIAAVRFKSDMYDWDADRQTKEYEKVREKHKQHLKETVEDNRTMLLQLKRLREDSAKSRYDFSAEWIAKEERRMQDANRSEIDIEKTKIDAWTRLRDRYKKDSDEYKKADEQVYQAKKKLVQAQFNFSSDWIAKETRRMEESGKSEAEIAKMKLDSWTRVRDRYAKDSEFYKKADEQVYQAKKKLIAENEKAIKDEQKLADEMYKKQKSAIEDAKKADLKAIEERKKAALGDYDARIKAIDALIAKEAEFNADADYDTKLAEKRARLALLESAVGPDGIKEREDIAKEIERMQLEHDRELRKRELESQKQSIQDEKSQREQAFEREKSDTEAKYEALKTAFEDFSGDVKTIESAISEFRIQSNTETNATILSDLDTFVSQYNAKMSQIQSMSAHSSELEEYNANKDAWNAAKSRGDSAEMARLNARNEEIRSKYGIGKDSGKLPSFDVGGVVPGPVGHPMFAVVHGGEAFFNQRQLSRLFAMLDAPVSAMRYDRPMASAQSIVNNIDMSVNDAVFEDGADVQTLYSERERTARRLQTMGVKNV